MGKRKKAEAGRVLGRVRGDRVRALRDARGWAQPELAWRSNCHPSDISKVENERRDILFPMAVRIAVALGTSTDYLGDLTDDPRPPKK